MHKKIKLAFVHSDPGAVNAINGLYELLIDLNWNFDAHIFHFLKGDFFVGDKKISYEDLLIFFRAQSYDLLFVGTSVESFLEYALIKEASLKNIPSIAIVDHWVNYRKRFERNGVHHWPTLILVNDVIARNEATHEGVPVEKIKFFGNPWWYTLEKQRIQFNKEKTSLNKLLFLSDNLQETWGNNTKEILGYTEFEVLESLIKVLKGRCKLVVRFHPKENPKKFDAYLEDIEISQGGLLDEEAFTSKIVVGMFSNALIESSFYNACTIRYEPSRKKNFLPTDLIAECGTQKQLQKIINRVMTNNTVDLPLKFDKNTFIYELKKILNPHHSD